MKKIPVWKLLVEQNIFPNKKTALGWIMAGKVLANNHRVNKIGQLVPRDSKILVKRLYQKYVSRGGLKLENALVDFNMDITDKVALDVGASTGGFTDCLLQHGVAKVYAIDIGFGQLAGKLRIDDRVVNMENTNISDVSPEDLQPKPSLATIDFSYLSLKKGIPIVSSLLDKNGEMVCLVKPLFEVDNPEIRRTGKIDDSNIYRVVLKDLIEYVNNIELKVLDVTYSHVTGNKGTREFFLRISLDKSITSKKLNTKIDNAMKNVMEI